MNNDNGKLETFAIVEVMGHQRYAGMCREVAMGGTAMIRVDVPEIPAREEKYIGYDGYDDRGMCKQVEKTRAIPATPAFTKFFGVGSIYSITPCSEEVARKAVEQFRAAPVTVLDLGRPQNKMIGCDDDEDAPV